LPRASVNEKFFCLLLFKRTLKESKEAALSFFKAAQSILTADEFQTLRVLVSKLKDAGEKNDTLTYLTVAREMLKLLLTNDGKNDLVALLLPLLPPKQQPAVQAIAQELRAMARQLKVKESLSSFEAQKTIQSALFRSTNNPLTSAQKIESNAQEIEERRREKEISLTNAELVVKAAKKRVCDGVNKKLNPDFGSKSIAAQRGQKLCEVLKPSRSNGLSSRFHLSKKTKCELEVANEHHDTTVGKTESVDLNVAKCLQQVSVVSFLTDNGDDKRLPKPRINTNTPKGLVCTICEEAMKTPMAAACNHYACKKCWKQWLIVAKNQTCPVCRMPAELSELSLVVFERQTGAGAPSLTQLCSIDLSSSDDD
jgi:hypothetical protein